MDLFCGAGGAAVGYHRAGFDVIGVDIEPQPDYPFPFIQADALAPPVDLAAFDAVHASPPCQSYSTMTNRHASDKPKLIDAVRSMLEGHVYVIENVTGARADMRNPLALHGGQFGLDVYRPRLFECSELIMSPPPAPRPPDAVAVYGPPDGRNLWVRTDGTLLKAWTLEEGRAAMGMEWATAWHGIREAIPPAYTEYIGAQLVAAVRQHTSA